MTIKLLRYVLRSVENCSYELLPARRRQKKLQEMIDNLKSGDKVVTSGGIYGTIVGLKDDRIQLRIAENVKIELSRNAVTALQGSETE